MLYMQHSDLQKTLHELQSEIRSLSDQQVGGCWCRQFMDWCLLFLYKPEWCLPCVSSTKHGNRYDHDCPSRCYGNSKGIIPCNIIFYSYSNFGMWKTVYFCCCRSYGSGMTATRQRHHGLLQSALASSMLIPSPVMITHAAMPLQPRNC